MLLTSGCSITYGAELIPDDWYHPDHWELTFSHKLAEKLGVEYTCLAKCGNSNYKIYRELIRWFTEGRISEKCNNQVVRPSNCTHMVVLWSQWMRDEIFSRIHDSKPESDLSPSWDNMNMGFIQYRSAGSNISDHLSPKAYELLQNHWFKFKKDGQKMMTDQLVFMQSIQTLCDAYGIKLIQGTISTRFWSTLNSLKQDEGSKTLTNFSSNMREMIVSLRDTSRIGFGKFKTMYPYFVSKEDKKRLLKYGHPNAAAHTEYAEYLYTIFQENFPEGEKK